MTPGNTCKNCGENCNSCTDGDGACTKCADGYRVSSGKCVVRSGDCNYEYGNPANPAGCLEDKYDDYRLIPPFSKSDKNVNWEDWGVVAPARAQGSCGSCWAFDVISTVETWHAIVNGPLYHLSEQHLVDCDSKNSGCNGGWPTDAYKFMNANGYILRDDYPYANAE